MVSSVCVSYSRILDNRSHLQHVFFVDSDSAKALGTAHGTADLITFGLGEKGLGPLGVLRQLPFGITGTINTRIPPLQIGYLARDEPRDSSLLRLQ
jgi:hypothetical protein